MGVQTGAVGWVMASQKAVAGSHPSSSVASVFPHGPLEGRATQALNTGSHVSAGSHSPTSVHADPSSKSGVPQVAIPVLGPVGPGCCRQVPSVQPIPVSQIAPGAASG